MISLGPSTSGELTDIKSSSVSNLDNKSTDDLHKIGGLNLAEFLSQLEDYTPTVNIYY